MYVFGFEVEVLDGGVCYFEVDEDEVVFLGLREFWDFGVELIDVLLFVLGYIENMEIVDVCGGLLYECDLLVVW